MKTLVLHIGMAKTGTSAIQNSLGLGSAALREQGVVCAPWKPFNHSFDFTVLCMHDPKKSFFYQQQSPVEDDAWWEKLDSLRRQWTSLFESVDEGTVIVSAENLTRLSPAEIRCLLEWVTPHFDRVRAIAYVRDPLKSLRSQWEQDVKEVQEPIDAQSLLRGTKQRMGYRFLACWSSALGAENLLVRKFDPVAFYQGNLIADFFHALGLDAPGECVVGEVEKNQSLGPEGTAFLLALNSRYPQYRDGAYNPQRGLARRLHLFYSAMRKVSTEPLQLDIRFDEEEAARFNRKIQFLNQFLGEEACYSEVVATEETTRLPGFADISADYLVDLVNELAHLTENFAERNDELEAENRCLRECLKMAEPAEPEEPEEPEESEESEESEETEDSDG
jgi:hypothetical protein